MARIRTVKPEFFTSDDICALSPLARLLYIGLWCEADREGRLIWTPSGFKRRYLPDDNCEIEDVCAELIDRTLVRLYGDGLACIPKFSTHQHVNPREAPSRLPEPPRVPDAPVTGGDASIPDVHAQVGKEGKGTEGKEGVGEDASLTRTRPLTATFLEEGWKPTEEDIAWAKKGRPDLTPVMIAAETERFINHASAHNWMAHAWSPKWRNWISKAKAAEPAASPRAAGSAPPTPDQPWPQRMASWRSTKFWQPMWGPKPGESGCVVPKQFLGDA